MMRNTALPAASGRAAEVCSGGGGGGGASLVDKDKDVRDADGVGPLHQQVVSGQVRPGYTAGWEGRED